MRRSLRTVCPMPGCVRVYPRGSMAEEQHRGWHVVCTCGWIGISIGHHRSSQARPEEHSLKMRAKPPSAEA